MKMNYTDALTIAIDTLTASEQTETTAKAVEKLTALRTTYQTRNENRPVMSDEKKAELSAKRKAETAAKRAELMAQVLPVLRTGLTGDMTAKELYEACAANLPEDFSTSKVQYILLHEMATEVDKTEAKGKPNTYKMKG